MVFKKNNKISSINQRKSTNRSVPGSFGRLQYLQNLVSEYQQTEITEHKEQVCTSFQSGSNLKVDEGEARLVEFALGGLSNLSASSPLNRQEILNHIHLPCIVACTTSPDSTVVVHSLTIIIHLFTRCPNSEDFISLGTKFPAIIQIARQYCESRNRQTDIDPRIPILSQILLEDCCNCSSSH
uniref:Uncharacterized protein n=1 Tax=Schistosoma haematobium TaxID=6185 RepID=A0A094ZNX0_SCHHA